MTVNTSYNTQILNSSETKVVGTSKETKETEKNFASFLENTQEETQELNSVYKFLDEKGYFNKVELEDAKVFREILFDGSVCKEEIDKLSYKQLQQFEKVFGNGVDKFVMINGEFPNPNKGNYIKIDLDTGYILKSANLTKDEKFNTSLMNTIKDMTREGIFDTREGLRKIEDFFMELRVNLGQLALDDELRPSYISKGVEDMGLEYASRYDEIKDRANINFKEFLETYIPMLLIQLEDSKQTISSQTYDKYKGHSDIYQKLRNNFNKLA